MGRRDERFLALLQGEQGKLLRIAKAITGQEADAWDMVQEATLTAFDRFDELRGGDRVFAPWIRRILINRARNLLKSRSRLLPLEPMGTEVDPTPGPDMQLDQTLLWDEVMCLEMHHRHVLVLRFLVDLTVEEIAHALDVPVGTVKSRIHRALAVLRKRLTIEERGVVHP
jgi:RNA polymerase sigma-70 factor (ECF subfamily)